MSADSKFTEIQMGFRARVNEWEQSLFKDAELGDKSNRVFHFTSQGSLMEGVYSQAESPVLRAGAAFRLNDPMDAAKDLLGISYSVPIGRDDLETAGSQFLMKFRKSAPRETKLFCFSGNLGDAESGHRIPSMWAHYAGAHTGACLVFSWSSLVELAEKKFGAAMTAGPVEYSSDPPSMTNLELRDDFGSDASTEVVRRQFFKKHPDWQNEREWRIVVSGEPDTYEELDVGSALRGVVLGPFFPSQYEASLARLVGRTVPVARLEWEAKRCTYGRLLPLPDDLFEKFDREFVSD